MICVRGSKETSAERTSFTQRFMTSARLTLSITGAMTATTATTIRARRNICRAMWWASTISMNVANNANNTVSVFPY